MSIPRTLLRNGLPALLALVAMRALVPVGYMPGSIGGLILELCHESVPPAVLAALRGETKPRHHGHHGRHAGDHGGHGDHDEACNFGHLLSQAFIDSSISIDVPLHDLVAPVLPTPEYAADLAPRYRPAARAPPAA